MFIYAIASPQSSWLGSIEDFWVLLLLEIDFQSIQRIRRPAGLKNKLISSIISIKCKFY